jgi:ligand-binding sensor domain-containing protein
MIGSRIYAPLRSRFAALSFFCFAHTSTLSATESAYHIDVWKVDEGLPQSSVTAVIQTHDGYLWVGTFQGFARFDGVRFKAFDPANSPGLPNERVVSLFEDRRKTLWLGTEGSYLVRWAEGRFHSFSTANLSVGGCLPRCITQSVDGGLWMITYNWELARWVDGVITMGSTNWGLTAGNANGLTTDHSGQTWVGTETELATWIDGKFQVVWDRAREPGFIADGLGAAESGCWVVGNGRIRKFKAKEFIEDRGVYLPSKSVVSCVAEGSRKQVWVGTYGNGIFCCETNGITQHLTTADGLPTEFIRCFCEDREGNLWVGTEGGGLVRIKPAVFRSYGRREGLPGECILSVCEGDDGDLWIGTNGDGVLRMKNGKIRTYGMQQGLTNEFVWSVYRDNRGTIWAGTWGGGLFQLDHDRFVGIDCRNSGANLVVCGLREDVGGALWLGQQRAAPEVVRLCAGQPDIVNLPSPVAHADVRLFAEDRTGNFWVGTYDDGIYRVRGKDVVRFGHTDGLASERIRALFVDEAGALWVGTARGGLSRFDGNRFFTFRKTDGLADDSVLHIAEDNRKSLWCSSETGVFRVSKQNLEQFRRGDERTIRCFSYTRADGLPTLECTGGSQPTGCKTRDGRLWFPTVNGLAVVDPETVPFNPLPPPVKIEEVLIEGKDSGTFLPAWLETAPGSLRDSNRELRIPPGRQRCEIHFTSLSFTAPEKVRFKYKLSGLEEDWMDAGTRRSAQYSYLRPGHYRFQVIACNNDGVWNDIGDSLGLVILPHYWQTAWFRLLAVALILLLFVAAYELRLASERRVNRLRLRIARDLHDEVGSNLGSIALLSEVMPKDASGGPEELSEIRRVAQETVESLRDIVWFLDPASDNLTDLLLRMKETVRRMLPGIPCNFTVTGSETQGRLSLEFRRNIFPMFKEILHNIGKHASATHVDIAVQIAPDRFTLSVIDNGIGFDQTAAASGSGLKNLRRRAADVRGELTIHSRPAAGTTIQFSAPIT